MFANKAIGSLVLVLATGLAGRLPAETLTCENTALPITVTAAEDSEARIACDAVAASVGQLGACGLGQTAPIAIQITAGIIEGKPDCLGVFHCDANQITLLDLDGLTRALHPDHPLRSIPLENFFASLVTHEMTHALLYQTRGRRGGTNAEDEYVAYAMQLGSLSEEDRNTLLSAYPLDPELITPRILNDLVLTFSPMVFGALAWRHFDAQENGCAFIEDIIAGRVDFSIKADKCDDPATCAD